MKVNIINVTDVYFSAITKVPSKTLITMAAIHQHPLYYCKKRLFAFEPFAQTEWLQDKVANGKHYFFSITYTEDTFDDSLQSINNTDGTMVPIVSLEENAFWNEVMDIILKVG